MGYYTLVPPHPLSRLRNIQPRATVLLLLVQREAADTQRRLYVRQSELEGDLEDLHARHDALRVEMARMDASMQDAADASFPSSSSSSLSGRRGGGGVSDGSDAARKATGRDPASMGAEVGGAVGGIFRGRFWSGWGGGGGGGDSDAVSIAAGVDEVGSAAASKKSKASGGGGGGGGKRSGGEAGAAGEV